MSQHTPSPAAASLSGGAIAEELIALTEIWRRSLPADGRCGTATDMIADLLEQLRSDFQRKPRIALLGEFNSGKTTLACVLARTTGLPTSVLANTREPLLIHQDGSRPDPLTGPDRVRTPLGATAAALRPRSGPSHATRPARAPLLEHCSILDTPGLADPGFASDAGTRASALCDVAVWCSMAGSCWRESERAAWDDIARRPAWRSMLVVNGIDLVRSEADRAQLAGRLARETAGRFAAIHYLSAARALKAIDPQSGEVRDAAAWTTSGAAALETALAALALTVDQRRRERAGRWVERLLRRLSSLDDATFARRLWLTPALEWARRLREMTTAGRLRRIPGETVRLSAIAATLDFERGLVGALSRFGHDAHARAVSATIGQALRRLQSEPRPDLAMRELMAMGPPIFDGIAQIMRLSEHDLRALADLRARLSGLRLRARPRAETLTRAGPSPAAPSASGPPRAAGARRTQGLDALNTASVSCTNSSLALARGEITNG